MEKEFEGVTLVEVDMAKELRSFSESGKGVLHPGLDATMCSLTEEYTFLACGKTRKRKTTFCSTTEKHLELVFFRNWLFSAQLCC